MHGININQVHAFPSCGDPRTRAPTRRPPKPKCPPPPPPGPRRTFSFPSAMPSPRRLVPPLLALAALCRGAPAAFSSAASALAPPGLRRATATATSTASANSALRLPRGGDLPMAAAAAAPPGRLSLVPTGAAVVEACGRIAPAASVLLSLSPLPTIRGIVRAGTVGDLPLLPYSSLVANGE